MTHDEAVDRICEMHEHVVRLTAERDALLRALEAAQVIAREAARTNDHATMLDALLTIDMAITDAALAKTHEPTAPQG